VFVLDTLPFIITTAQATATEQKVFGFTSFGDELLNATGGLLRDIILGPILAVPLGFVGASLFLLPAFLLVGRIQKAWTFIAAGAVAGLAHALIGIALAQVDVFAWFSLALGHLPYGGYPLAKFAFSVGAVCAGAAAGKVYWKLHN